MNEIVQKALASRILRFCGFVICASICQGLSSCATEPQPPNLEGKRISELIIRHDLPENANHGQDRLLRRFMKLREGIHYSNELADQDLVALFESGLIDDARILAEPHDQSIRLIVEVRERPRCGPCRRSFIGNTAFSDQRLAKVISPRLNGLFTESKTEAARQEIERYYRGWGYKQVRVDIDYEHYSKRSMQDFAVVFVIEEGPRTQPWYEGLFRPSEKATAP